MHMADALLTPAVGGSLWLACGMVAGVAVKKIQEKDNSKIVPLMGVLGAFVFAAQMVNFTIPGTGSSGHITGGILLAALLGKYAGFMTLAIVLLLQSLFFADGGILAYGGNAINMGFYACFIAYPLICRPLWHRTKSKGEFMLVTVLGSVVALELGAASVVVETTLSGISALPFSTFALFMLPIHLAIGIVEGLLTGSILLFVQEARPELLQETCPQGKYSLKKIVAGFALAAVLVGGVFSLQASDHPDGLEWSLEKVMGSEEIQATNYWHLAAEKLQNFTALFPDYNMPGKEAPLGTSIAGVGGGLAVCAVCLGLGKILHKDSKEG